MTRDRDARHPETARIRVVHIVPDLGMGGAERHVTVLLPMLDRATFDPSVICLGVEGALFADLAAGGVPAIALRKRKTQMVGMLAELTRELRRIAPDVVIMRGYNAELVGRLAAVLARVPVKIVWTHNDAGLGPRGRVRTLSDRLLDRATDAYFGVAESQRGYLAGELGFPADKTRIIHNGVDPDEFAPGPAACGQLAELGLAPGDQIVGIVAALRAEKDHEVFLRAARAVLDKAPATRFLVIGDGELRAVLEGLSRRMGLTEAVVFAGSRGDVRGLLRGLDVFVLCSRSECFPMSVLEAMAVGLPGVCTDVGGIPEMITDGESGFLAPPRDPDAVAARVVELLESDELRRRLGAGARERVLREFTLDRSVRQSESELRALARPPIKLDLVLDEVHVGGVEKVMLDVLRFLDPRVVAPRLVCLRTAGTMAADFRALGVEVEFLGRRGWWDVRTLPRLIRTMRRRGTDAVLVTHHHRAALALGRVAAKLARVPVNVVAPHDMDLTRIGKRCLPRWAVNSLSLSDAMVLLSARQGEYLRDEEGLGRHRWSSIRQVVVPNGIEIPAPPTAADRARARSELGLGGDEFVVGIVARLSAQKAHQVLFAAFARVLAEVGSARLVVVGMGDREEELRSLAGRLGIGERTLFTGVRRDVPELLPAFDVACLSSVHEGVPITVIEAMVAGLPVVATDCGSLRDMVAEGETGFLAPVGDAAALADRLVRLARDPGLRKRLGANGRAVAEREFRIEDTARGYQELLTELVRSR